MSHNITNFERKTWDVDAYRAKAKAGQDGAEEAPAVAPPPKKLRKLEARGNEGLGVMDREGKTQLVSSVGGRAGRGGFYCEACDWVVNDTLAWAAHCNSPQHLANMGISLEQDDVVVDGAAILRRCDELAEAMGQERAQTAADYQSVQDRVAEKERKREESKAKRDAAKAQAEEAARADAEAELTDEQKAMREMMGFSF